MISFSALGNEGQVQYLASYSITYGACTTPFSYCTVTVTCNYSCKAAPSGTCTPHSITTTYTGSCVRNPNGGVGYICSGGPVGGNGGC